MYGDFEKKVQVSRHQGIVTARSNCADVGWGAGSSQDSNPGAIDVEVVGLYDRYFDFVWRNLKRLGVHSTDLEDAAQDVFIVVHQRIATFEYRASVKSWIFAIAQRVAMAYRRRGHRRQSRIMGDETLLVCSCGSPEDERVAVQTAERIQRVLDDMDDDKRAVFVLADLEDMPGHEIAAALGIPRNTVYTRLRLARIAFENGFKRLEAKDSWRCR